jgi:hypothetical protein
MLTQHLCIIQTPQVVITYRVTLTDFLVLESERFDKDFAVADQRARAQEFDKKQDKFAALRDERYQREAHRFEQMSTNDTRDKQIL